MHAFSSPCIDGGDGDGAPGVAEAVRDGEAAEALVAGGEAAVEGALSPGGEVVGGGGLVAGEENDHGGGAPDGGVGGELFEVAGGGAGEARGVA